MTKLNGQYKLIAYQAEYLDYLKFLNVSHLRIKIRTGN